jgi:serine/arginine repetitive matrix protein 2
LLIELGGGTPVVSSSVSAPAVSTASHRERAITLAGDESKPSAAPPVISPPLASAQPNLAWRASTGRHDLSQRQLVLLKEILDHPSRDATTRISEEESHVVVDRDWRWGDAMNSTVTLQSEYDESSPMDGEGREEKKKVRRSRIGMGGLRDMLRGLKKSHTEPIIPSSTPPLPSSTASLSTDSSSASGNHQYTHPRLAPQQQLRRRMKTSTGPDDTTSPYNTASLTAPYKSSPRRPSLASIFRIGQKHRASATTTTTTTSSDASADNVNNIQPPADTSGSTSMEEEDWDQMDSASDLDAAVQALGVGVDASTTTTVKGRGASPYLQESGPGPTTPPKKNATAIENASCSSIWGEPSQPLRNTRLSNVEESVLDESAASKAKKTKYRQDSRRPTSRKGNRTNPAIEPQSKTGSVRSAPPTSSSFPDPKLAMTPDNIRPLLENSRQVQKTLAECIGEMRALLAVKPM